MLFAATLSGTGVPGATPGREMGDGVDGAPAAAPWGAAGPGAAGPAAPGSAPPPSKPPKFAAFCPVVTPKASEPLMLPMVWLKFGTGATPPPGSTLTPC